MCSFFIYLFETNRLIGKARFVDEHTIMVNENFQVRFKSAVISTGSAPVIPFELSRYGADSGVYTTNDFFDIWTICQIPLRSSLALNC